MSIYNAECTRCPLAVAPRTAGKRVCVPGEGPTPSDILFYGEAPGASEEEEARPFIGAAGRELDVLAHEAGLERSKDFFIGNPVRCRPPANRRPTEDEVKACLFYTIKELAMVKPKVIVALGGAAIQALTGLEAVGANRGKLLSLKPHFRSDIPVIPTYHPAAFLHNAGRRAEYSAAMIADFKVAKKITQGTSLKARIIHGFEESDAKAAIKEIARCDEVGVDLEWEVLPATRNSPEGKWPWSVRNGKRPQVITYGFAANVDNEYVAVSLPTGFTQPFDKAIRFLALKNLVGHNMMSDAIWLLYMLGEIGKITGDTYILPTLLNLRMSLRLKSLASTLTEMPPGWDKEVPLGNRPRSTNEWRRLLTYNAQDAIAPLLLHPKLIHMAHELRRERVLPLYREIQLPAIAPLAQAAINGTPLDVEMVQTAKARADSQLERAVAAVSTTLNLTPAQVKKKKTLAGELERQAGITFPTTAKKQEPQITLDSLDLVKDKHPAVPYLIKKSKLEKLKTTYFDPWLMLLAQQGNNKLHSVTKLSDPSSGRTSAEGEAGATMQQFPRRTKGFRQAVRAREGWGIASVDHCLAKGTGVRTTEGLIPIEKVKPGAWVFGAINRSPVVRKVVARKYSGKRKVFELTTSDGAKIRASGDHRFMLFSGEYARLSELRPGDRLLAIRRREIGAYTILCTYDSRENFYEHRIVAEGVFGNIPGFVVHHKNGNGHDNSHLNLEVLSKAEHSSEHLSQFWEALQGVERADFLAARGKSHSKTVLARGTNKGTRNPNFGNFYGRKESSCLLCAATFFYYEGGGTGKFCSQKCYHLARKQGLNHTVVSVRQVGVLPTYDLQVDDCENYEVEGGLISHNSMMELRIAAWLANEPRMLAMLREGKDLHKLTAGWMKALAQGYTLERYLAEQDAWMSVLTDEERYGAKPFNFGLLFGGSGNVVQSTARKDYGLIITREEADVGSRGFFQLYPQLPVWHESCWRFVRQGYTESPLGHQRLIPEDKRPDEQHRISINTPVQGTASYFSVFCANYTGELLMREYGKHTLQIIEYLSFIHDQGLYHFDMKEEATIKAILREGFEHPPFERLGIEFPVPLEADVKVAPTWK